MFASAVDRVGFYLLACCVAFAPIPFGSNSDGFAGLLGVTLSATLLGTLAVPQPNQRGRRLCGTALAMAVIIALWSALQVAPLDGVTWVSPTWSNTRDVVGGDHEVIAVARYQPLYSLGYVLLPFGAFISGLVYVRDSSRFTRFLNIVVAIGLIVTVFCIGQYFYAPGTLLWAEKRHYLGSFTGSFVNPNTAATYFGVLLLMALSAGLRHMERVNFLRLLYARRDPMGGDHLRWGSIVAYLVLAFVFFVALMLTQSRAGITSSLAGASLLIGAFTYLAMRRKTSQLAALGLCALVLSGAALLVSVYGGRLMRRVELEGLVDDQRACTFKSTWRAIEDHFWQGTGLGTFQDVFPRYRLPECGLYGHWNMAHNLFLEGTLSLGVGVFALICAVVYVVLLATYARGMRERRRLRFVPLVCLCILVTLTLHSLVDFSLQIPAVAVLACCILGAGAAISVGREDLAVHRAAMPMGAKPLDLASGSARMPL
jgi:O-antigen ligase